jgi:hypothetical protein
MKLIVPVVYVKPPISEPLCESGFVTLTLTAPAAWAGVVAVIDVLVTTMTLVAAVPPNVTVAPLTKFVPVIVTLVLPTVGPEFGETLATVGALTERKLNPLLRVPLSALGLVTATSTDPAACAGVVAVIAALLTTVTLGAAMPPKVTVAPLTKFVPVIVTAVPPLVPPELGETLAIVGAVFGAAGLRP